MHYSCSQKCISLPLIWKDKICNLLLSLQSILNFLIHAATLQKILYPTRKFWSCCKVLISFEITRKLLGLYCYFYFNYPLTLFWQKLFIYYPSQDHSTIQVGRDQQVSSAIFCSKHLHGWDPCALHFTQPVFKTSKEGFLHDISGLAGPLLIYPHSEKVSIDKQWSWLVREVIQFPRLEVFSLFLLSLVFLPGYSVKSPNEASW